MEIDNAQRLRDWLRECPELAGTPIEAANHAMELAAAVMAYAGKGGEAR